MAVMSSQQQTLQHTFILLRALSFVTLSGSHAGLHLHFVYEETSSEVFSK